MPKSRGAADEVIERRPESGAANGSSAIRCRADRCRGGGGGTACGGGASGGGTAKSIGVLGENL
jgi:hypothetical protein